MAPVHTARRIAWRYYGAMLSAAGVASLLGAASAYAVGSSALLPDLLLWIGVLIAGVNLAGSIAVYRPIRRYLTAGGADIKALELRARMLPAVSGLWVAALTMTAMVGYAVAGHGSWRAFVQGSGGMLLGTLVHCLVFATYLGLYCYLLALDHLISLRKFFWKQGRSLALPRRRFAMRLAAALAAVGFGPALIAVSDRWSHPVAQGANVALVEDSRHMSQFLHQTLHMDVLGALLLSAMVAVLLARGLSRPVNILLDAMRRVDSGDFLTKAPVVSDDEFGMLTQRFNRMLDGLSERERLRRTFAHFVPQSVAAALLADEGAISPQEREATVLFADIERFTEIAAVLGPREVMVLLNGYFSEVAEIIHARGGVITQFQGDAVLASFNLPAVDLDHARHAVDAALELQRRLAATIFRGGVRLRARIGICTGLVVGGTVGGGERLGYTVHGNTVNLASRLEALNKDLGTRILLSARTAELLDDTTALRDLGPVKVRGFNEPLRLFEPLSGRELLNQVHRTELQ